MKSITKETVTTQGVDAVATPVVDSTQASGNQTIEYIIYFIFGVLEILLTFRLLFKVIGANVASNFVSWIYSLTGAFIYPFEGIFSRGYAQGVETTAVLEPATIVAIIVYGVIAWGIVVLFRILSGQKPETVQN